MRREFKVEPNGKPHNTMLTWRLYGLDVTVEFQCRLVDEPKPPDCRSGGAYIEPYDVGYHCTFDPDPDLAGWGSSYGPQRCELVSAGRCWHGSASTDQARRLFLIMCEEGMDAVWQALEEYTNELWDRWTAHRVVSS